MKAVKKTSSLSRQTSLKMDPATFKEAGTILVNKIARFLKELPEKPVTTGEQPKAIQAILGQNPLPLEGESVEKIMEEASALLFDHSLFNGHPRFWGYITSSAAPAGALADLLAAAVNPNVGAFTLSPMATEMEKQTIKWLAEFIGYPTDCGGVFVSGGNMANFIGFLAARKAKVPGNIRKLGLTHFSGAWGTYTGESQYHQMHHRQLTVYCARGTHTWVQKAADLFGHGTDAIRWIDLNPNQQMDMEKLDQQLKTDLQQGHFPFLVIGTAGSVGTGSVDSLSAIADLCRNYNLWFHIDGAYGAPAAVLPENAALFEGLNKADSIAIDPHKWLFSALEAGCVLVRDSGNLQNTFSFHPEYYNFDGIGEDPPTNFYDYGLQNSRGFKALKVWVGLRQVGKNGYMEMIRKNIALAKDLYDLLDGYAELEPISHHLSITCFRYVPKALWENKPEEYLNNLNEVLLNRLQTGGEVFLSNAIIDGKYCLRICIVNFRTEWEDMLALPEIVLKEGKLVEAQMDNPSKDL